MRRALAALAFASAIATVTPAAAQVIVNGKMLTQNEIAQLAFYSCGPIFPGNYWLDMRTGDWGYAGSYRVEGHIRDRCGGNAPRRTWKDGNLSGTGRLYSPGELLR